MIKLKHVKPVKDRHGNVRYYFRTAERKLVPMVGAFGSVEFAAHHAALMTLRNGEPAPETAAIIPFQFKPKRHAGQELDAMLASRTREQAVLARAVHAADNVVFKPGTLGWAAELWVKSREYATRPDGTRRNYGRLVELLRSHPFARGQLADLRSKHLTAICKQLQEERGLSRGRAMLAVVSNIWEFACDRPEVQTRDDSEPVNPARVAYRKVKYSVQKQHKRWPVHICKQFLSGAPDHLRLMFNLALFTGQRRSDVQAMKWEHYDAKTQVLNVWQKKGRQWVPVPVHKQLAKILAETPRNGEFILTSSWGQHYRGESSLSHAIRDRLLAVGIPDGVYTPHGLRVTAAHILAENGADEVQLMRIFGWKKPDQAHYYIREANAAKIGRAGMAKWEAADEAEVA